MIITEALSQENSLQIANTILIWFKALCNNVHVSTSGYSNYNSPQLPTVICRSGKTEKIITTATKNGEENLFQVLTNHVYKLIWYNRLFYVTFYTSPKVYSYYSALPNFDITPYIFCSIIEMQNSVYKKYEMNFGLDIEKGTFLELFDVIHFNTTGIIREYPNLNTPLEAELKDVVII